MTHIHDPSTSAQGTWSLTGLHCTGCADAVEAALRVNPHITSVHLDWPNNLVHVSYQTGMVDEAAIQQIIESTGCPCETDGMHNGDGNHAAAGTTMSAQARLQHLRHGVDMQPITMGTKHDRMQYELPATGVHDHHTIAAPAKVNHSGIDHSGTQQGEMDHSQHAGMNHSGMQQGGMDHSAPMGHDMSDPQMAASMEHDMRNTFFIALVLTIPTVLYSPMGVNLLGIRLPIFGVPMELIMLVLTTPVIFYCGWMFISGAYYSLRRRALNMSVLVATGVLAAYVGSVLLMLLGQETFFEAGAMLVTFVLFGHWMEMRSRKGTSDALRALFDLVPPQATVIRDGQEVSIASSEVQVGDLVLLRPGDKVPVDGEVSEGETSIDESLVTGESVPVSKHPGDQVIAGAINLRGSIRFHATKVGADTALAQIVALVQRAQSSKAPGQRLADQAAHYLVILAVGAGIITFLAWLLTGSPLVTALTFAISAVVIACPDALGLATPTAVAVGTGIAARHNILVKDAATLEGVSRTTAIVLDKTGTLTEGKPALTDVITTGTFSENDLLHLVASAEQGSEHPLAESIVAGARERGVALVQTSAFEAVAGHGIQATVDGRTVLAGNRKLMRDTDVDATTLEEQAATLASAGKTPMFVAVDGQVAGLVAVADTVKPTAAEAIRRFKEQGITPIMITGDNQRTAAAIAQQLGIERFFAEVLPADKAHHVQALQGEGNIVAMVGDGVNDAPALAQADTGIAIGAGTDVAIETADIVLMKSDPLDILNAITISKATVRKMKQNLVWASVYNVLAIPIAAGALYPAFGIQLRPEWSALLMSASSIIVAVNAVLLRTVDQALGGPSQPHAPAPTHPAQAL